MNTILAFFVAVLLAFGAGGWIGYDKGQEGERAKAQAEAAKQSAAAQKQTDTWREAYEQAIDAQTKDDPAQRAALAGVERALGRLQHSASRPQPLPAATPEAVGRAYEDAERDIAGCANDVGRFGREAANAARSHQRLDGSWPTRQDSRTDREAARNHQE